jgi:hypothetical protein
MTVEMSGVSGRCLEELVSYLYTGELHLTLSSASDLIAAAERLGIPAVVELCHSFLVEPAEKHADGEPPVVMLQLPDRMRDSDVFNVAEQADATCTDKLVGKPVGFGVFMLLWFYHIACKFKVQFSANSYLFWAWQSSVVHHSQQIMSPLSNI